MLRTIYKPEEVKYHRRFFPRGGVFFDIGVRMKPDFSNTSQNKTGTVMQTCPIQPNQASQQFF